MRLLKKNIVANFAGSIWQGLIYLAFVPLYIKFMGVESYGLVGVYITLQAMFLLLDMGLSVTLNREMARLSTLPDKEQEMQDLARSLEIIYWGISMFIGIALVMSAPFFSYYWVKTDQLSPRVIERAFRIMGVAMAFQWPVGLYSGGLMGLQKQVLLNIINCGVNTVRSIGAVLVLWLISPTIQAFFSWQVICSMTNTCLLAVFFWRQLAHLCQKARFNKHLLKGIWRFAAGMSGITILGTVLGQLDKVILSNMLSLEMFGYYTLASIVALSLYRFITPVFSAIYPKFTQLVSVSDVEGLKQLYHKSCQLVSVLILPVAIVVAMFSYHIMLLWTRNPVTADKTYLLVTLLISGTALNGLGYVPYALQCAYAWVKLGLYVNSLSVVLLVPITIFLTRHFGAVGGASVWVILNVGYFFIVTPLVHNHLLPHENRRWYWQDVGLPFAASFITALVGRLFLKPHTTTDLFAAVTYLGVILIAAILLAAFVTPTTRGWLLKQFIYRLHSEPKAENQ
ncbi:MAG: Polysaccharide biosynthesis protein [Pelotomaculum sp. PtaU1.Bin065]|jgi:O-antigen/teichoic acid export membrane protein|nr:MAG: Polysaccharide biosynthesis protein [Pelotomaculum sp. PtaU1.Bin065]